MIKELQKNTPETDAKASPHIGFYSCATVPAEFARKLERERDKAREDATNFYAKIGELECERDEARREVDRYREEKDLSPMSWDT